ncbi:hypothetical protein ANTQUA_LOCUS5707 [Anthophora quadrimaculata]
MGLLLYERRAWKEKKGRKGRVDGGERTTDMKDRENLQTVEDENRPGIPLRKKEYHCWVEFLPTNRITSTNHDLIELADLFLVRGMKGSVELVLSQA